ncbi:MULTISPECIES: plasmid partitioning protein RepB C-terminal domain-containing protein [Pseudomonas]|uniref:plasmid partitioning protein RepB C-terminal domain-containing protein n=1 Tax=Pseudomonas TaxID=286 RepID=UPI0015A43C41|nr:MULTISPECIES: plasmid partitioning protein RepB C-terminal domain-containing protein [Pseudomonas]MCK3828259.1 ParB/RepB/Spo0J family partition protein [Pseudomonas sp. W2Aug9]NWC39469.1 ParB/RepB/Spo0J family partition protein [Pseudomonas tolaasii]
MSKEHLTRELKMIPLEFIEVLNTRERNGRVFDEIVGNIKNIGLKKPITVTPRPDADGSERYLLICGEGRLKAYSTLGESSIPAMVVSVSDEDAFLMSLAENIARRQCRPLELLAGIEQLRDQGYDKKTIAQKTGLSADYVYGILQLLKSGEERLLVAVESGRIPLNAALAIAGAGSDTEVQAALQDAYESGKLRGKQLIQARRVIERRRSLGRSIARGTPRKAAAVTSSSLIRSYQKEVERQKLMVKKAEFAQQRLLFVIEALRQLLSDDNFTNLLRAEGLDTLPKYLAERVWVGAHTA